MEKCRLRQSMCSVQTRFRSTNNVTDAKLESTSLSTDVVQGSDQNTYSVQGSDSQLTIFCNSLLFTHINHLKLVVSAV